MIPETPWLHDWIAYALRRIPPGVQSILDVGTARGAVGSVIEPLYGFKPDGIEIWPPYAEFAKKFYRRLWVGDALEVLRSIESDCYDVVLAFEVIEHMTDRDRAFALIAEMERVGKLVMVSSLNWFDASEAWDGNPNQLHHCRISAWDMLLRGYSVRGVGRGSFYFGHLFRYFLPWLDGSWLAWTSGMKKQEYRPKIQA